VTLAAGCWLAWASAPLLAAEKLPSGAFQQDPVSVGQWALSRITSDEAGRSIVSCQVTWTRESDLYVYASLDIAKKQFALGIPAIRLPKEKQATMRVWFDEDKAHAIEGPAHFIAWSGNDEGEDGYLVLVETSDKPAMAERLAAAKKVSFAYPFQGKTRVETFPFKSAAKAVAMLSDCANGR